MSQERLAARLRATFLGELDEQLREMNRELLALEADPARPEPLRALFRSAHTLKGAAHAAGIPQVGRVCHELESMLAALRDGRRTAGPAELRVLFEGVDALGRAAEELGGAPSATPSEPPAAAPEAPAPAPPTPAGEDAAPAAGAPRPAEPPAEVRVEASRLDALLGTAGELALATERLAGQLRALEALEADAAEAGRRAGAHDRATGERLRALGAAAARLRAGWMREVRALGRLSGEVGDAVHGLRLRPFADACQGLPRLVRDVAAAAGKEARLELGGQEVEADREVWRAVRDALLHLVRNAVDHGLEPPAGRAARGKPKVGTVSVSAGLRGGRIQVIVADDGAGLDLPALRERLRERGAPVPEDDQALVRSLFRGGLSSRREATAVSGRAVGLDSARAALERIHGGVQVDFVPGAGTTFTLDCPPALSTVRAVLAVVGEHTLALPTACVEHLQRVRPAEVRRMAGRDVLPSPDGPVPLVPLAALYGGTAAPERPGPRPVLRLRSRGRRLAVSVDALLAEQELLVRPVRALPARLPWLGGAALLASGRVALVLDAEAIIDAGLAAGASPPAAAPAAEAAPRILVVDDSITTRTLEQSILEAAGYRVLTAPDGAAGWRLLQEQGCDLVVSDVEMPGLDGLELCRRIRASRRHQSLPVILVTARESAEHRAQGLEAGADAYVAKSSFDQEALLEVIRQLVGAP